ncbi:MAG TPA: GNAT family N-acetyltransferase [Vicinamibacteria bacterium]|nr:GNAT family N-acetyltransferase [Vicinamibacteria bacterium]
MWKEWVRQAMEEVQVSGGEGDDTLSDTTLRYLFRDEATGLLVREATSEDAAAMAGIGARAFRHAHASLLDPWDMARDITTRFDEEELKRVVAEADSHWLVAIWDRTITGFAQLQSGTIPLQVRGSRPLELRGVYVAPDWMRIGVGSALIRSAVQLAKHLGNESLFVTAWAGNANAIDFFKAWGFAPVGRGPFRIGRRGSGDLVILARPVPA